MEKGIRQTFYLKTLPAMKKLADEEHYELTGSTLETAFWNYYVSDDPDLREPIIFYYLGEISFKNCLDWIVRNIAYQSEKISKNNLEFVQLIKSAVGKSSWISKEQDEKFEFGDYSLKNRKTYFDSAFDVLNNIIFDIQNNLAFVQNTSKTDHIDIKPWTLPVVDKRYEGVLTDPANYEDDSVKKIEFQLKNLRERLTKEISPGDALELIISNWQYLWPFSGTYEAIEYCLLLSKDINENEQIRKQLRDFTIKKTAEEKELHRLKVPQTNRYEEANKRFRENFIKK